MKKIKLISLILATLLMLSCFAGCGNDASIGKVDGVELSTSTFKLALTNVIGQIESNYGAEFSTFADQQISENMTVLDYAVNYAITTLQQSIIVDKYFDELGLVWNETATAELNELFEANYASYEGGKEALEKSLADEGIEVSALEEILTTTVQYNMIAQHLYGENGVNPVTDDEIKEKFHSDYARVKHILVATVDTSTYAPFEGDELAAAEAKYAEVEAKVKALAPNDEEGFNALMKEYNEDPGMNSMPDGYVVTDNGQFVQAFVDGAFSVGVGEYAFEVSEEYGYHILMRLPTREADVNSTFGSMDAYIENYRGTLLADEITSRGEKSEIDLNDDAIRKIVEEML